MGCCWIVTQIQVLLFPGGVGPHMSHSVGVAFCLVQRCCLITTTPLALRMHRVSKANVAKPSLLFLFIERSKQRPNAEGREQLYEMWQVADMLCDGS